eukprot:CAMPEP_0181215038 /NCGR_PEP_ID=MMETSP1096-20121128/25793_1 /TAXON_ID=156174 ORGANISM="Chrysochromulina ericina, Strain CCMP281" /NCGR_SAMPLE_ID=MMETSP1096 /ASSEMBLY_ACC=CAM_ASM_000453 /LENGTH=286 /DNA_ID=CAMNT_0023306853 /DNA_START=78 /DNA_END=938 /DNA_ORIENTATION=+
MTYKSIAAGAAALFMTSTSAFALTVSASGDAGVLASAILGSGVTITSATYTGVASASGTFAEGGDTGIGITEGLILTTGAATDAIGPNSSDSKSVNTTAAGFSSNGNDASILDISFKTDTGALFFDYVFASEEYNEFTNSGFNDQFLFLLSGPGVGVDQNIALIPGTNTVVSINTVNGGNPIGTNASNSEFFNDNDPDTAPGAFNIEYDGFTDVFTASATGLTIGEEYSIKLIIEDIGDSSWDSAVFIKGGSFGGTPTEIPVPASLPLLLGALGGLQFMRKRKQKS